jgi:type IV pilus assembly protein PilY1
LLPSGQWAAVFGNGLNSDNNHAVLYIRDAGTGASIAKLDTGSGDATHPNGLATPAFLDTNGDRIGDVIYAGDFLGNVWKFEYNSATSTNGGWSIGLGGKPLFTAKDGASTPNVQHITGGMDAVGNPAGGVVIIFGTGKYIDVNDASPAAATTQTVYGIWDNNAALATTGLVLVSGRTDLQQQKFTGITTSSTGVYLSSTQRPVDYRTPVNTSGKLGWFLDLTYTATAGGADLLQADRVITAPAVILGTVLINTFMPTGSVCVPGGQNSVLELDAVTGSASFSEVPPSSGPYTSPPKGASGTVIGTGSPQGDPSPVVNMQDGGGVPAINCKPGDPGCTSPPFPCTIKGIAGDPPGCDPSLTPVATDVCKWVLPNSANKAIQKPISCGRVSWRQIR